MAEGILSGKAEKQNLNISVDSAGTSNYHIGNPPDSRMQEKAIEHGLNISKQKARQFKVADFEQFDYIFAMDKTNQADILNLARNEADRKKVVLFLNYSQPSKDLSVPDPYYGGAQGFEDVYQMLSEACNAFIKTLENE